MLFTVIPGDRRSVSWDLKYMDLPLWQLNQEYTHIYLPPSILLSPSTPKSHSEQSHQVLRHALGHTCWPGHQVGRESLVFHAKILTKIRGRGGVVASRPIPNRHWEPALPGHSQHSLADCCSGSRTLSDCCSIRHQIPEFLQHNLLPNRPEKGNRSGVEKSPLTSEMTVKRSAGLYLGKLL